MGFSEKRSVNKRVGNQIITLNLINKINPNNDKQFKAKIFGLSLVIRKTSIYDFTPNILT